MQGLQGKKVIAIATGSLHCVCCTEDGRWEAFESTHLLRVMHTLWGSGAAMSILRVCLQLLVSAPVNELRFTAAQKSSEDRP